MDMSKILLALVPVVVFFVVSGAPESGTRNEMRFAHSCLMLMHLMVMSGAGVVGNIRLYAELKSRNPLGGNLRFLLICWLTAFAVVGLPIIWLFSASTSCLGFFLMFLLLAGSVAVGFGVLPICRAFASGVFKSCAGLYSWLTILVVVMLQCITLMSPILSPIGEDSRPQGKRFYIQHFFDAMSLN